MITIATKRIGAGRRVIIIEGGKERCTVEFKRYTDYLRHLRLIRNSGYDVCEISMDNFLQHIIDNGKVPEGLGMISKATQPKIVYVEHDDEPEFNEDDPFADPYGGATFIENGAGELINLWSHI